MPGPAIVASSATFTVAQVLMAVTADVQVSLCRYPYPYKAMLAIASDLDETPDIATYFEICRFLNTDEETAIGPGVALEVGNTMYFDMPDGQVSYWNCSEADREKIRVLIRSGHIDCFHSFGDTADSREAIARSLDELNSHDCRLPVWIDHAVAPSNFGADIMRGTGDIIGSDAFHADLTIAHGVRFVWLGRVTSIVGQNVRRSYRGIFDGRVPIASSKTLLKELAKNLLSWRPSSRYRMHKGNFLTQDVRLRSGHSLQQFIRCNPHPEGVSAGDRGDRIFEVLSESVLNRLTENGGASIIYTHLGKIGACPTIFPAETVRAFRDLATRFRKGEILVASTARVLDYVRNLENMEWKYNVNKGFLDIIVTSSGIVPDGLSFEYCSQYPVRMMVNGVQREDIIHRNRTDNESASVSLPWLPLAYPSLKNRAG